MTHLKFIRDGRGTGSKNEILLTYHASSAIASDKGNLRVSVIYKHNPEAK